MNNSQENTCNGVVLHKFINIQMATNTSFSLFSFPHLNFHDFSAVPKGRLGSLWSLCLCRYMHVCLIVPISLFKGLNFKNYQRKGRVLHLGLMLISASYVNDNTVPVTTDFLFATKVLGRKAQWVKTLHLESKDFGFKRYHKFSWHEIPNLNARL